jgi:hypothetical protein
MKSLRPSFKFPKQLPRLGNKSIYLTLGAVLFLAIALGLFAATRSGKSANDWQAAERISNSADIDLVFDTYIELTPEFSLDGIRKQLTATKVGTLIVYKFDFPNTCGFAGCLYVLSDGYARSTALQLWDDPYLLTGSKPQCLRVEQKRQKYEICL